MKRLEVEASGGCQCGAVRYHAASMLDNAHLCHCRMCQKAVGGIFAGLVAAPRQALTWTRGTPSAFMSSEHVARGFCNKCGTPLYYDDLRGDRVNLTIGSLDHPQRFPPIVNTSTEAMLPWIADIKKIADRGSTEAEDPEWAAAIKATSNQHPDRDTDSWPPGP